jgi:hypothetical protein
MLQVFLENHGMEEYAFCVDHIHSISAACESGKFSMQFYERREVEEYIAHREMVSFSLSLQVGHDSWVSEEE